MRPSNGPSMSNCGVRMIGPPDFKSFRKKRKLTIGDVVIWSKSGKKTYLGKSAKKRVRKKRVSRKRNRAPGTSSKVSTQRQAYKRAQKRERELQKNKLGKLRKKAMRLVQKRAQKLERLLREIKYGKPKKKANKTAAKPVQPQASENVMSKLELIQSILWKRRGHRTIPLAFKPIISRYNSESR